jgi:hypothetical protein
MSPFISNVMPCEGFWPIRLLSLTLGARGGVLQLSYPPWKFGDSNSAHLCFEIAAGRCLADSGYQATRERLCAPYVLILPSPIACHRFHSNGGVAEASRNAGRIPALWILSAPPRISARIISP